MTTGTLTVGATDRVWFNGANFGDNVVVGAYQTSTHISNSSDAHQCTTNHVNNVMYVSSSNCNINGGGSVALSGSVPTTAQCPLKVNFSDAASVATSAGKFYAYDGTTDATGMSGVTVQAIQQSNTSWTAANGLGSAVSLADQSAATSHDFFLALSLSPTSTGAKTGKFKVSLTYV